MNVTTSTYFVAQTCDVITPYITSLTSGGSYNCTHPYLEFSSFKVYFV